MKFSDRREQGSSNQGTSNGSSGGHSVSVVASQSSFQATAPPVTAAIPDVSSESAPLFAGQFNFNLNHSNDGYKSSVVILIVRCHSMSGALY